MTQNAASDSPAGSPLAEAERRALVEDLNLLVRLADRELDAEMLARLQETPPEQWFALELSGPDFDSIRVHLAEGLAGLSAPPTSAELDALAAEFAAIYLTHGYNAAPAESVWRDEDKLERQEAMFLVRDWYARFGVKAPDWRKRSDDHLVNELQFVALLLERADDAATVKAAAQFLRDHLLVWAPRFADRIAARCEQQLYAGLTLVSALYLERLGRLLGEVSGEDMTAPALVLKPIFSGPQGPDCGSPRPLKAPQNTPFTGPSW